MGLFLCMAEREGLFGTSLCLTLRARCAREKLLPAIFSNPGFSSNLTMPHNKKGPEKQGLLYYGGERGIIRPFPGAHPSGSLRS